MTLALKTLADGQLPNTKTTLYTTPASTQVEIESILVFNTGAGNNTVKLYIKPGGTSRQICGFTLATKESAIISRIPGGAGMLIEGEATNALEVDYIIAGGEYS